MDNPQVFLHRQEVDWDIRHLLTMLVHSFVDHQDRRIVFIYSAVIGVALRCLNKRGMSSQ